MTDAPDHPSSDAESLEKAAQKHKAAEDQAFADKLAKRPPPNPVERAEIKKARKRTKARAQRIAMHIENRKWTSAFGGRAVVQRTSLNDRV
jgi:hypothetical protein